MARSATVLVCLLVLIYASRPVSTQGAQTGILRGTVTDSQGLSFPNVTVEASSPALQGTRRTVTGVDGSYVFRQLPVGTYRLRYQAANVRPSGHVLDVPLGGVAEHNIELSADIDAEISVTPPAELSTTALDFDIRQPMVEALATSRTLHGIATLSPAVHENTPNARQLSINGAFAFDNLFMLNGVDVNDNLLGQPQHLFIEDAIAETQVLTSGISAEYGRFSGGAINAVTKNGGNVFSGSFRINFANPSWTDETPFEKTNGVERASTLNESYEVTLGGPFLRDRLWFFGAGRRASLETTETFAVTGIPFEFGDDNSRAEGKLTGTLAPNQTAQVGFLNNSRTRTNQRSVPFGVELSTLNEIDEPNWYAFGNYRGIVSPRFFVEAQFSERRYSVEGLGGTSTAIVDSPFISVSQGPDTLYNAPYFDSTDPEARNNRQLNGNATYLFDRFGRHEFKGGYEWYRSQRRGGNSQSSTGFVFITPYVEGSNNRPSLDASGNMIPRFTPPAGGMFTGLENWTPVRGAVLNIDTNSLYAQDHWRLSNRVSADIGLRFETVRSEATGGLVGVDTSRVVPRFGIAYDIRGDGGLVLSSTYAHYSGRYNEHQIGKNTNVGNADRLDYLYVGPPGQGFDFAPAFDLANYVLLDGEFPAANVRLDEDLSTPLTREFTVSSGWSAGARAYAEATYVWRDTSHFIEDFRTIDTGVTEVVRGSVVKRLTNVAYGNTDDLRRRYQAAVLQGRYHVRNNWRAQASWTVQLENDGNYVGEAPNNPGATTLFGDYPEAFDAARNFPTGRLQTFQRHRARLWTVYDTDFGGYGRASFSALVRAESGRAYSIAVDGLPLTATQVSRLSAYPTVPASQELFFAERGTETFPGYGLLDVAVNYSIPVFRQLRPWLKLDVFNLLNNQKLIRYNTVIVPAFPTVTNPTAPLDALGLPTTYAQGPSFGRARGPGDYPSPLPGEMGGRTIRLAAGIRF